MGRPRKVIHIPITTISVNVDTAEAINKSKRYGETQNDVINRLLVTSKESEVWKQEVTDWQIVYERDMEMSSKRIQMLESELKEVQEYRSLYINKKTQSQYVTSVVES